MHNKASGAYSGFFRGGVDYINMTTLIGSHSSIRTTLVGISSRINKSNQAPRQVFFFRKFEYVLISRLGTKNDTVEFLFTRGFFQDNVNSFGLRPFKATWT